MARERTEFLRRGHRTLGEAMSDKSPLYDIDPQALTGLRDALSRALNVSVTFVDESGKSIKSVTDPAGRRFVAKVCQMFHYHEDSPVRKAICDKWDDKAALAIQQGAPEYRKPCGLQFACVAKPIRVNGQVAGAIFAGERRIIDPPDGDFEEKTGEALQQAIDLMPDWPGYDSDVYAETWARHLKDSTITTAEFNTICDRLARFAIILGRLIEKKVYFLPGKEQQDFEKIINLATEFSSRSARRVGATVSADTFHEFLAILLTGLGSAHAWLWELLDKREWHPAPFTDVPIPAIVIFIDIRDFTRLTKEEFQFLLRARNNLFSKILDRISKHGGITNKFLGDGALVYFLVKEGERHLDWATRAASAACDIADLEEKMGDKGHLVLGIGIDSGLIVRNKFDFNTSIDSRGEVTALGSTVNFAQRLSSLASKMQVEDDALSMTPDVIVSHEVYDILRFNDEFGMDKLNLEEFHGIEGEVQTYSLGRMSDTGRRQRRADGSSDVARRTIYLSQGQLSSPTKSVVRVIADFYTHAQYYGPYYSTAKNLSPFSLVVPAVASLMGDCNDDQIGFRANTTAAIRSALAAVTRHIVDHSGVGKARYAVTNLDHPAVAGIYRRHVEDKDKFTINLPIDPMLGTQNWTKELILSKFQQKLEKIKLSQNENLILIVPHITWSLGVRLPIYDIASHAVGLFGDRVWIIVDGAHSLGHIALEDLGDPTMRDARIDAYASCGHKWLGGPQGTGILWAGGRLFGCRKCAFELGIDDVITHEAGLGKRAETSQVPTGQRPLAAALLRAIHEFGVSLSANQERPTKAVVMGRESQIMANRKWLVDQISTMDRWPVDIVSPLDTDLTTGIVSLRFGGPVNAKLVVNSLAKRNIFVTNFKEPLAGVDGSAEYLEGIRICVPHDSTEADLTEFLVSTEQILAEEWGIACR